MHWPANWGEPVWLWFGPEEQAPDCPHGTVSTAYEGHADLVAPIACEACTCEPPTGACALPSTIMASSKDCGDFNAGMPAPFNPPVPWDGSCDSTAQLPAGAAHAVKVGALAMTEVPARLGVIGAGVIGLEYASMFAALGVRVTLIDKIKKYGLRGR